MKDLRPGQLYWRPQKALAFRDLTSGDVKVEASAIAGVPHLAALVANDRGITTTDKVDANELTYGFLQRMEVHNEEEILQLRTIVSTTVSSLAVKIRDKRSGGMQRIASGSKPDVYTTGTTQHQTPIDWFGYGWGFDFQALIEMHSSDVNTVQQEIYEADDQHQMSTIMHQMLRLEAKAWHDATGAGPPDFGSINHTSSHNHYLATPTPTLTWAFLLSVAQHVRHHGKGMNGPLLGIINPEDEIKVREVAGFIPNVSVAGNLPVLSVGNPIFDRLASQGLFGEVAGIRWIINAWMPVGYFLVVATDAKPIRYREYANFAGLQFIPGNTFPNVPIVDSYWVRFFGLSSIKRDAGCAVQIRNGGNYANPSVTWDWFAPL